MEDIKANSEFVIHPSDDLFNITVHDCDPQTSRALFTIKGDGRIERGPAFTTVDEASLEFWKVLERIAAQNAKNTYGMPRLERATTRELVKEISSRFEMGGGLDSYGAPPHYSDDPDVNRALFSMRILEQRKAEDFRHDMHESRKEAGVNEFQCDEVLKKDASNLGDLLGAAIKKSREL